MFCFKLFFFFKKKLESNDSGNEDSIDGGCLEQHFSTLNNNINVNSSNNQSTASLLARRGCSNNSKIYKSINVINVNSQSVPYFNIDLPENFKINNNGKWLSYFDY